jgi:hypothetical protein
MASSDVVVKVCVDCDELERGIERLQKLQKNLLNHEQRRTNDGLLPTVVGVAAAAAASPRRFSRRSLFGLFKRGDA